MTEIENKNITCLDFVQKLANKNLPMYKWYIFILHVARKSRTQLGYHDVYFYILERNSYVAHFSTFLFLNGPLRPLQTLLIFHQNDLSDWQKLNYF
jgi:hypothetical protein